MKNKDLQEYLEEFSSESDIAILVVSTEKRIVYKSDTVTALTGAEIPAIVLEITGERDMDEEENAICDECERQPDLPTLKNNDQRKAGQP